MNAQVQIIERDGEPEHAVVPIALYRRLVELAEDAEDIAAADKAMGELARGKDEIMSDDIAHRLLAGENPLRVWRGPSGADARGSGSGGQGGKELCVADRGGQEIRGRGGAQAHGLRAAGGSGPSDTGRGLTASSVFDDAVRPFDDNSHRGPRFSVGQGNRGPLIFSTSL